MEEKQGENLLSGAEKRYLRACLLRAGVAAFDPELHLGNRVGTAERGKRAAIAGIPAPTDEIVGGDVFEELCKRAATGLLGIFELAAQFGRSATDKDHLVVGGRK